MTTKPHIRPAALLHGADAADAIAAEEAGELAGGTAAFALAEIIRRHPRRGEISRRWMRWSELKAAAADDAALRARLKALQAPHPPLAGLDWRRPVIMGILNVTPDSFSDGGRFTTAEKAIAHGRALAAAGADILDIGGESTRPGAREVPLEEELKRVLPVIEALAKEGFRISIDTRKAPVMEAAARAGAAVINDVSGLTFDPRAAETAARAGLPVILMHARGLPENMQDDPRYDDAALDVFDELESLVVRAAAAGVRRENVIVDPGIGFGKTLSHNLRLMRHLPLFHGLGAPLLLGASRKRFIGEITGVEEPARRLAGSLAAAEAAWRAGVQIVRVHDVAETAHMARMSWAINNAP